jgi:glyoxylase-like metal-dependent hydrolase (beta-lactamase superfamily II)
VKRVQEGIYQLISPFPEFEREEAYRLRIDMEEHPRVTKGLPYVMPYAITSRGETLLVDCGWATDDSHAALSEQLNDLGLGIDDITNLVLTHAHPDHCGLAGRLKEEADCAVFMHELEIDFLRTRYTEPEGLLERMGEWLKEHGVEQEDVEDLERGSMPVRFFVQTVMPDNPVEGGETINVGDFVFEVVWTPGHAPGHICLYEPNHRLFLSGDHVLPMISPNVSLHPQQRENPLQDYIDSLEKVKHLKVDRVLPAHEWDIDWFKKRVDELLVHHESRLDEMVEAVGIESESTASDVARRIRWNTGGFDSFSAWMKRAAIGETLAHLRFLAGQGRLKEYQRDGVTYFAAG